MNKKRDYISWLQIVPNPFGEKFKKSKSNDKKISHDQFFEHFENLYSNIDKIINHKQRKLY